MITTKLFIGCHVSPELRIQLNQSLAWKQSRVAPDALADPVDITHEGRPYLGYFVDDDQATLEKIREITPRLKGAIRSYCSAYPIDDARIYVFPQLFVS